MLLQSLIIMYKDRPAADWLIGIHMNINERLAYNKCIHAAATCVLVMQHVKKVKRPDIWSANTFEWSKASFYKSKERLTCRHRHST